MEQHFDELVTLAAREGGKPLMDSRVEVLRAIDGVKNCIECIRTGHGMEIPMQLNAASANRLAFTSREPIGVVVAFSAFNHPLNLIVHRGSCRCQWLSGDHQTCRRHAPVCIPLC